jgi:dolichol-phosphate mannosyltransferase
MPELTIVLPTFNERENIPGVIACLANVLLGIDYELIFVDDDSEDGTAELVAQLAQGDRRLRVVHRINRRGLSSACVEGMMASSAPYIVVMDADMQHDERILPAMFDLIRRERLDIVVGSRRVEGGSMGNFAKPRLALSDAGRRLAGLVVKNLPSDPMSGYFIVSRTYLQDVVRSLSGKGFKILLDLLASSKRPVRMQEVPYTFRNRQRGESKLDILVGLDYLQLLLDKTLGRWLPVGYLLFALIGGLGLLCHLLLVSALYYLMRLTLPSAQAISGAVVIAANFMLNNQLTFRAMRLKGIRLLRGLALFYAACAIGLVANVRFAQYLSFFGVPWYVSSLAGIVVGSVWNYALSKVLVWRMVRNTRHDMSALAVTETPAPAAPG